MRLIVFIVFIAVFVLGIGAFLSPDDLSGCADGPDGSPPCQSADAIVAVSGGDTSGRADEAIRLYQNGWAPLLVFSGAAKDISGPSNAATMKRLAIEAGVPESSIMIEEDGQTTQQNAEYTYELLAGEYPESIIVVTSPYHQRRASLDFGRAFKESDVRSHPVPRDPHWSAWWWTTPRGWYLALGELAKMFVQLLGADVSAVLFGEGSS